ncbi:hypothetical protein D1007_32759 [Hordeum vulgare]|nr:hypothetical protein D1007_32759 [Hordeum vulgare]
MAKSVWSLRDDEDDSLLPVYGDETDDSRLWLHGLCNALSGDRFVTVLTTLWAIWWARRRAIHEQEFQSPLSTHLFIQCYLSELRGLPAKNHQHGRPARTLRPRWIPPATGETKMNVDGAVAKSSNTGAVRVICRSDQGGFLGASAVVIPGMIDPEVLEAHACTEAIALAEDMMVSRVRIASDYLRVVDELKEQVHRGAHCMILNDIQGRISSFSSCVFIHEFRKKEEVGQSLVANMEPNAKHCLFAQTEMLPHAQFVKLAVTLWVIWSARRKAIHEGIFQSPHSLFSFTTRFIGDLESIKERKTKATSRAHGGGTANTSQELHHLIMHKSMLMRP